MKKQCKFCKKTFITPKGPLTTNKIFCEYICQQEWWRYKRNKTGDLTRRDKRLLGQKIRNTKHLTKQQLQICYGGLLGDSSLSRRSNEQYRLKLGHSEKQLPYLKWKKELLKPFIIQEKATYEPPKHTQFRKQRFFSHPFYIYNSIIHQDFTNLAGLFYCRKKNGKRIKYITQKLLNKIQPLAILIWYLDDGHLTKDKMARIATNCFSLSENKTIKRWFWHKYRIKAIIYHNIYTKYSTYFIGFNVNDTKKFFELFKPFKSSIPECMHYKLYI